MNLKVSIVLTAGTIDKGKKEGNFVCNYICYIYKIKRKSQKIYL